MELREAGDPALLLKLPLPPLVLVCGLQTNQRTSIFNNLHADVGGLGIKLRTATPAPQHK